MAHRPALSKGKMEVARVVWQLGQTDHASHPRGHDLAGRKMDFATVQTYLRRLEAKGYLRGRTLGPHPACTTAKVQPTTGYPRDRGRPDRPPLRRRRPAAGAAPDRKSWESTPDVISHLGRLFDRLEEESSGPGRK